MILKALRDYLIGPTDLTGPAAALFEAPQTLGDLTLRSRNDARRYLRDRVGSSVYAGRIPQGDRVSATHTAIVLRRVATNRELPLIGELPSAESFLEVSTYTRGVNADYRGGQAGELARIATINYVGYWGSVWIGGTMVERDGIELGAPEPGTDSWSYRWRFDLRVWHSQAAAVLPVTKLTAAITSRPGTGGSTVYSARTSHVPAGRAITNVAWSFRNGSGVEVLAFGGAPESVAAGAGVSGTNIESAISGLPSPVTARVTVTDDNGDASTAEL